MAHRRSPTAAIGAAVQAALRQDRLLFAFQPVVCATSGRVDYFECLLRMREPDGNLVACGEFIAAIEQVGLIGLIDRHVLERAFAELAAHPAVRLGFNVSGRTACDRPWLRTLMSLLRQRPDLARRIVVEITETAALDDFDESARFVETLRHAGCRVALDDFGAGHTSLRHLQMLAIDTIKIDGSFVRSLASCRENRVILRHLLGLTRGFGLHTVAECVETAEEAALLREEGIGFLQGYHIGRPTIERPWGGGPPAAARACE
jgi:EAL domain-containing protein (putative c-di-GMP-specific phosphodiesterase class I)